MSAPTARVVCFVTPPSVFLLDERTFPNIGILKVAAVVRKAGFIVEKLDLTGIENFLDPVLEHAMQSRAFVYGVTTTTPQLPAARAVIETIRKTKPGAKIIIGGPHVTLVNSAAKRERKLGIKNGRGIEALKVLQSFADVLVAGDGEEAIFAAFDAPSGSIIDADDRKSDLFLNDTSLEKLPFPARDLIDLKSYHYSIEGVPATSLIAQLGCPFACGFCGGRLSPSLRITRTRSTEHVVKELRYLSQTYGYRGFMLYDDELNVNKAMIELMNAIALEQRILGVEWRLRGFVKAELFTDAQAEAMYKAGFRWILTGFESGSPKILTNINKKATQEENTRCVEIARRHGLKVKALMSIGHPGESEETIRDTRDWLLETKPDDFDVTIITTYPGTPYFDEAVPNETMPDVWTYTYQKSGDRLHSYHVDFSQVAEYYKGDPNGGYKAYVFTDHVSADDLVRLRGSVETEVRKALKIPFNHSTPALRYEHSMGQMGPLPQNILRTSTPVQAELRSP